MPDRPASVDRQEMTMWRLAFAALIPAIAACKGGGAGAVPTQPILSSCEYSPERIAAFNAAGGSAPLAVATQPGCRFSVTTSDGWMRTEMNEPFNGPLQVSLTVDPNRSFESRSGVVVVTSADGATLASYAVLQRAAGCLYSIDKPLQDTFGPNGTYDGAGDGPVPVQVRAQPATCQWTAAPSVSWIRLVFDSSRGTGDRTIYISILDVNRGPAARRGDVVIAGLSGLNPDTHLTLTQLAAR